ARDGRARGRRRPPRVADRAAAGGRLPGPAGALRGARRPLRPPRASGPDRPWLPGGARGSNPCADRHGAATVLMPSKTRVGEDAPVADDSELWLRRLRAAGPERDAALTELHALLLRAARFEVARRHATSAHLRGGDRDDLALQSADDALVALLGKLDSFRGDSRFTTWAYKFALYEAAAKIRRQAWQGRGVPRGDHARALLD